MAEQTMIFIQNFSRSQIEQAMAFSRRANWTTKDVAKAFGVSADRMRKWLRLYDKFGPEVFAEDA